MSIVPHSVLNEPHGTTLPNSVVSAFVNFEIAFVDFERLRRHEDSLGKRFNLPALSRLLVSVNVRFALFRPADGSLTQAASRLGFLAARSCSRSPDWLTCEMRRALAFAEENGPLDLVLVGAECRDVEIIRRLRATGGSVTVVNWPDAFDLELVQMANRCIPLPDEFLIAPAALTCGALRQAA